MYALMVDGLFGPATWMVVKTQAQVDIARRTVKQGLAIWRTPELAGDYGVRAGAPSTAAEYDCEPVSQIFGEALLQDAMKSTMEAFGRLMNVFPGYNQHCTPPSRAMMALRVRTQCQEFSLRMIQPLFASKRSSMLHKLLYYAAEEIELRVDFSMADTSPNEQKHKEEKAASRRTNRHTASAGRQLLSVSQARIMLQAEEAEMAAKRSATSGSSAIGPVEAADPLSQETEDSDCIFYDEEDLSAAGAPPDAVVHTSGVSVSFDVIMQRPGLGSLASLLHAPLYAAV